MKWRELFFYKVEEPEPVVQIPEQPAHCETCGGSLYITDRDNNGVCDPCWAAKERVTFEENQREEIEQRKARILLQRELAQRGPFV